jgi:peptidoglycan/LPS O-acetylase OafA/YrhL
MFISRKRFAALGVAALAVLAAVAALFELWAPALALLALLNGAGLALLIMGAAHQQELRRIDKGVRDLEKRLEKVAARVVATGEATRVELIDRLADRG